MPGDPAVEPLDHTGAGVAVCPDDIDHVLRVQLLRQGGRSDDVAEQGRDLPALPFRPQRLPVPAPGPQGRPAMPTIEIPALVLMAAGRAFHRDFSLAAPDSGTPGFERKHRAVLIGSVPHARTGILFRFRRVTKEQVGARDCGTAWRSIRKQVFRL